MLLGLNDTDTSITIQIVDDSGLPVTGLVAATMPTIKLCSATGADVTVTLSDLASLSASHSDGGVYERGEGYYRLDLPDSAATSAGEKTIRGETTDKRVIAERIVVAAKIASVTGAVGSVTSGVTLANDSITSSAVAASAVTEIQSGLALASDLATLTAYVDTEVAAIKAKTDNLPADPADASDIAASFASIASTLSTIAAYIDTEVAAIKAKTDNLPADPADASDIASSFTSIASTLTTIAGYVDTEVAAIKAVTDKLDTALQLDGSVYRYTANALELAPSGGGSSVTVTPLSAGDVQRVDGTDIVCYVGETHDVTVYSVTDSEGTAVNLSTKTLKLYFEVADIEEPLTTIAHADITVSGGSSNNFTFGLPSTVTDRERDVLWSLRDTADGEYVLAHGTLTVTRTAFSS